MSMVGSDGRTGSTTGAPGGRPHHRPSLRTRRAGAVLAAGLLLGGGLAACGSSGSSTTTTGSGSSGSGAALATSSRATMTGLTSFRVTGTITSSSQHTTLDLVLTPTTSGGTITTSQGPFQLISDGTHAYLSATSAFWTNQGVPAAAAATLAGRWVTGFPAAETKTLTKSLDVKQLLGPLYTGPVTAQGTTTVAGQQAHALRATDGSTAYIAATGPPYLLQVSSPDNGAQGKVTFSEFGSATPPAVPTGAIDISTVKG